jgi:hypothetical protein
MQGVSCTQGIGPCRKGATTCATPSSAPGCADVGVDDERGGCGGGNVCKAGACVTPCQGGVACTQGIKACHKGATFCATPTSDPVCNDSGVDDSKANCASGQVCKNGDCVAPCQGGVACTQGIPACHKGATFCATPTSAPVCNDSGVDDSKGGCSGGQVCSGGQCVANPCVAPSAGNLVPNPGFDSTIWPKIGSSFGPGTWNTSDAAGCPTSGSLQVSSSDDARICVTFGAVATIYAGYMVNRSTAQGEFGCYVDTWYLSANCQDAWDYGNVDLLIAPNLTGWRPVSAAIPIPASGIKSLMLACHAGMATVAPVLLDRFYLRTSPGEF